MTRIEEFIDKITTILKILPVHTEVSISVTENNTATYYGLKNEGEEISYPKNKTSAFEIGSVTKSFTGNILAQLVVEGTVSLDDPISYFLHFELKDNPAITLKQLGMHTSGLPRMPIGYDDRRNFIKENPFSNYYEEDLISYLKNDLKIESQPGERVMYSNLGFGLLSYIMSRIQGQSFAGIVETKIFKPLKMQHSVFSINRISTKLINGLDKEGNYTPYWDGGILDGCIGIISTSEDLAKFAMATLDVKNKTTDLQVSNAVLAKPEVYSAIGWVLVKSSDTESILKINGGTAGSSSSIFLNRQNQKVLTFCSNIHPDIYMNIIEPLCSEVVK
ncbi:serine hydrolase domain-containing protein [Salmonirosea aquatica]|uniref:Serine hydrolase n=1 Tax=Salmonirosea aquatica TaxID=2654236 RepID=A0A7C9FQM5_9BACT|nr:serine hydrolase [Cytophagaceae bacterium SJW1-29]